MKRFIFVFIFTLTPLAVASAHSGHDESVSHDTLLPINTEPIEPRQTIVTKEKQPSFFTMYRTEAAVVGGGIILLSVRGYRLRKKNIL